MAQPKWSNFTVANLQSDLLLKWSVPGNRHEQMEQRRCSKSYPSRIKTFRLYTSNPPWMISGWSHHLRMIPYEPEMVEKMPDLSSPSCVRKHLSMLGCQPWNCRCFSQQFINPTGLHPRISWWSTTYQAQCTSFSAIQLVVKMSVEMLHEMVAWIQFMLTKSLQILHFMTVPKDHRVPHPLPQQAHLAPELLKVVREFVNISVLLRYRIESTFKKWILTIKHRNPTMPK